jgi:topoisomerase (DNA) II binding protein 1
VQPSEDFPVPAFAGLEVTVTQLDIETRVRFKELVEGHGGQFSGDLKDAATTHLIACEGSGEKFRCALGWRVRICRPAWIEDCVRANGSLLF